MIIVKGIKIITFDDLPLSNVSAKIKADIDVSSIKKFKDVSVFIKQELTWHTNPFNFQFIPVDFFNVQKQIVRDKIDEFIDKDINIENLLSYCFYLDENNKVIDIFIGVPSKVKQVFSSIEYTCQLCKKTIFTKMNELPNINYCTIDNKCIYLCDDCKEVHSSKKIGD